METTGLTFVEVVSPMDAFGCVFAALTVPGVDVEVVVPRSYEERLRAAQEYAGWLLVENRNKVRDPERFLACVVDDALGWFGTETDPAAVLVRIETDAGARGMVQLMDFERCAQHNRAVSDHSVPLGPGDATSLLS